MQKTIFITGASTGLGKATAKLFQSKGWTVIATMRKPERETELTQLENVSVLPLDVTNAEQIKTTIQKVISSGKVDVVFNNAAYGLMGALEYLTDEQIISQINTNLLGVLRVTKEFIPHFKENLNGLIITTTSIAAFASTPMTGVYNATKWALEGWAETLSYDLKQFNISVKTIIPGGIKSNFAESVQTVVNPEYESLMAKLLEVWFDNGKGSSTPEFVAEAVYEAVTDGKDQLRYIAGQDATQLYNRKLEEGSEQFRIGMTKKLYS